MGVIQIFIDETVSAFQGLGNAFSSGSFDAIVNGIAGIIWAPPLVLLCLGAGLYFSIRTNFLQVRKVKKMVTLLFGGSDSEQGISSFQAFALAVAGRVGIGNIVGVATAIAYGGPGALFWMWVIAFLGAGSAFVEATLAQVYKEEIGGEYRGGPAYYFGKRGRKTIATVFMIVTIISTGLLLPGIQSNSIGTIVANNFGTGVVAPLVLTTVLIGFIIIGGGKRLAKSAEIIVPFMSGIYILATLIIIALNITRVPEMFGLIFSSAFGLHSVLGGSLGWAILWGVKRGVFSNEAGQGTAPHVAAAAEVSHPAKQGLVQAFSVYFDTLFVCSATGFAILMTGQFSIFQPGTGVDGVFTPYPEFATMGGSAENITNFTPSAFDQLVNGFGGKFVAIALFFFAFTTLMAMYFYAQSNLDLIMKKYSDKARINAGWALKIAYLAAVLFFGIRSNSVAWAAADIGVGAMAWINIIGILFVAKPALILLKDFEKREKEGTDDDYFYVESLTPEEQANFHGVDFWTQENIERHYNVSYGKKE